MKIKTIIPAYLFFLASISLFPIEGLGKEEFPKPKQEPSGTWLLDTKGELFGEPLLLRFYMKEEELKARRLFSKASNKAKEKTASSQKEKAKSPLIWNLRKKNGEYLYGWLRTEKAEKALRCKVWQKEAKLFLRVYSDGFYKTYQLSPFPLISSVL